MKKIFAAALALMLMLVTATVNANDAKADKNISPSEDIRIDYGASKLFSKDDMDAAITEVLKRFETWQGCELHSILYVGDECNSAENLRWMNELAAAKGHKDKMVYCMEFLSDFYVSREAENHTTFNPETEYKNWQWWLARSEKGEWQLLTFGY
ncbi:MAG: hypothetical protein IJU91_08605 [Selenomonadaceae bacterium]|nr:hypothetical protein [Selenomonadaceae bacterium]